MAKAMEGHEYHAFENQAAFEEFLDVNHLKLPEVHLKIAKKASGIPSITPPEAVEVALCFGWIDAQGRTIDENWHSIRYMPRRPKSIWSLKNVNTVKRFIAEGEETGTAKMRPAGLAAVEAAKQDGRWDRAYAGPATIEVPEDLKVTLEGRQVAKETFYALNKTDRYLIILRVVNGSVKTREHRVTRLVECLDQGKNPLKEGRRKDGGNKGEKEEEGKEEEDKFEVKRVEKPQKTMKKTLKSRSVVKPTGVVKNKVEVVRRTGLRPRS